MCDFGDLGIRIEEVEAIADSKNIPDHSYDTASQSWAWKIHQPILLTFHLVLTQMFEE